MDYNNIQSEFGGEARQAVRAWLNISTEIKII
jgi:hypothetical protein